MRNTWWGSWFSMQSTFPERAKEMGLQPPQGVRWKRPLWSSCLSSGQERGPSCARRDPGPLQTARSQECDGIISVTRSPVHPHARAETQRPSLPRAPWLSATAAVAGHLRDPCHGTSPQPSNPTVSFFPAKRGCQATGLLMSWQLTMSLGGWGGSGAGLLRCSNRSPLPCAVRGLGRAALLSLISPQSGIKSKRLMIMN